MQPGRQTHRFIFEKGNTKHNHTLIKQRLMEKSFGHHLDVQEALALLARPSVAPTPCKWVLSGTFLIKRLTETRETKAVAHELPKTN
jgi:hypothetical protein